MTIYQKGNQDLNKFEIYNPLLTKKQRRRPKQMKRKVEKAFKIDDGKHTGKISDITYKTEPYEYIDINIEETDSKAVLKCGVPFHITENSSLGMILINFGCDLKKFIDKEIEVEDYLKKGMEAEFLTQTEATDKGKFSRVIPSSLKPK